jgi:hypothetical protein
MSVAARSGSLPSFSQTGLFSAYNGATAGVHPINVLGKPLP